MGSDLRTDSTSNPGVWQGLGAISQRFGIAGKNQFSQMICLGFVLFWGWGEVGFFLLVFLKVECMEDLLEDNWQL